MLLPSPSDYQDTIQNPATAFADPELRQGIAALNHLGLPRVASGNFNSVYEMQCGSQRVAVRCLLRNIGDQKRRYDLVSRHLEHLSLPSLVEFAYLAQGIRVRGHWHPIVKMEWVEGVSLHTYVAQNLHNVTTLRKLAARWRGMVNSLRGSYLAHGDLQHGNALVTTSGDLKLVDYDAMFVPALQGERSSEIGHINYQHPKRDGSHYDERLDAFAALVIYVSIRAVAVAPDLWAMYHNGDNLLFKRSDFNAPQSSPLFQHLHLSPDPVIIALSQILEHSCTQDLASVPDLEQAIHSAAGIKLPPSPPIVVPVPTTPHAIPAAVVTDSWWQQIGKSLPSPSIPFVTPSPLPATESLPPARKVNSKDGAAMIWIPAGEFIMGAEIFDNPRRIVVLSGYYIYEKPVTVGQYTKFVDDMKQQGKQIAGHAAALPSPPDFDPAWKAKEHPIVNVTWFEAAAYAEWAGMRLPTEAEWEKAARGTDGRIFPWGDEFDDSKLWCSMRTKRFGTGRVGLFSAGASPFGILDMAGNIEQWCSDWYGYDYSRNAPLKDPKGPPVGDARVVRGSRWTSKTSQNSFGAAYRNVWVPGEKANWLGFRCAL